MKRRKFLYDTLLYILGIYGFPLTRTAAMSILPDSETIRGEKIVLAQILYDNSFLHRTMYRLKPSHFQSGKNQIIFQSMCELYSKGEPIDLVTLTDNLQENDALKKAGNVDYIVALID